MQAQITGIKIGGDPCNNLTLDLQATGTSSAPSFFWNFGDPASGTKDTVTIVGGNVIAFPTHTFSAIGVYNVCVTFTEPGAAPRTVCRQIFVGLCCTGIITASDSCVENVVSLSLATGANVSSITWNFGDAASGNNTANGQTVLHRFSNTGSFTVTALVVADCGSFTVVTNIPIKRCVPPPVVCDGSIIKTDSCLANGTQFSFRSDSAIIGLNWNFGDPASEAANQTTALAPRHRFSSTGNYTVTVVVNAVCGSFTTTANITVFDCSNPCNGIQGSIGVYDSCLANNVAFTILPNDGITGVTWDFGDPASGTSNQSNQLQTQHRYTATGRYTVTATVVYSCGTFQFSEQVNIKDCSIPVCAVSVANAFSPNDDGVNDFISPLVNCVTDSYDWKIFNRWGQQVFHSKNSLQKWDGKLKSKPLPVGVYYYLLTYKIANRPEVAKSGSITLVR